MGARIPSRKPAPTATETPIPKGNELLQRALTKKTRGLPLSPEEQDIIMKSHQAGSEMDMWHGGQYLEQDPDHFMYGGTKPSGMMGLESPISPFDDSREPDPIKSFKSQFGDKSLSNKLKRRIPSK